MTAQDAPTISIVIPAYNEATTIRACVVAAIEQTEPADEIIVVDNRSTDATLRILNDLKSEFPDAPLVVFSQDDEQGLVPTRNFGLDRAMGEVLGRIDADTVLEPTWVEEVRRLFTDPSVGAATGPMIYYDMPLRRFGARADDTLRRAILKLAREYHFVFGSNMAIRASAWRDIRGVVCRDEADEFHEDIDISIHLFERNHRVVYGPRDGGRDVGTPDRRQPAGVPELRLAIPAHVRRARHRQSGAACADGRLVGPVPGAQRYALAAVAQGRIVIEFSLSPMKRRAPHELRRRQSRDR